MTCVFCAIIKRELPASVVYDDDRSLAFLDLHPVNEGHVLIIPKQHHSRFTQLSEAEAAHLFKVGRKILKAIQETDLRCEGANLFLSDGPIAGQEVMHSHLHIVPRFAGDGHRMGFSHADPDEASRPHLQAIAGKIAEHLRSLDVKLEQPTLVTDRLILEPFKESDLPDIFEYARHPEVARFVPWEAHKDLNDSKEFLSYVRQSTSHTYGRLFFVFAIRLKESGRVIGSIDFKNINPICGQIDYALGVEHWGKGIMSEAAACIRDWAFSNLPDLVRLQAFCVSENVGSSRVTQKIRMLREGERKKAFMIKGKPVDLTDYALIRE